MTVEVFCHGRSMGITQFQHWEIFEAYMMRWLTESMQINIRFDSLQEQQVWYSEIVEMIRCLPTKTKESTGICWRIYILRIGEGKYEPVIDVV